MAEVARNSSQRQLPTIVLDAGHARPDGRSCSVFGESFLGVRNDGGLSAAAAVLRFRDSLHGYPAEGGLVLQVVGGSCCVHCRKGTPASRRRARGGFIFPW